MDFTSATKRIALSVAAMFVLAVPGMRAAGETSVGAQHLRAPEHVTSETRAELHARMSQHGETMSALVRSVVLLDRPKIRVLASRIADEEVIAGAGGSKRDRKPLSLPQELYAEQTKLSTTARALAVAAVDGSDDRVLAERFATVTATCVTCHGVYLHGRPEPRPVGRKDK